MFVVVFCDTTSQLPETERSVFSDSLTTSLAGTRRRTPMTRPGVALTSVHRQCLAHWLNVLAILAACPAWQQAAAGNLASEKDKKSEEHGTGWRGYWENGGVLRFEEEGMKAGRRYG